MAPVKCSFASCGWKVLNGSFHRKLRHLGSSCDSYEIILVSNYALQLLFYYTLIFVRNFFLCSRGLFSLTWLLDPDLHAFVAWIGSTMGI